MEKNSLKLALAAAAEALLKKHSLKAVFVVAINTERVEFAVLAADNKRTVVRVKKLKP